MATLQAIKKRIASVKNTEQITRAMYRVSVAKLRRAQMAAENSRPYGEALSATIVDLAARAATGHPLLEKRPVKKAEIVLFTSDRGLCGGYNANLIRTAERFMRESCSGYDQVEISVVGKRAADYLKRRRIPVRKVTTNLMRTLNYELARSIADELTARFLAGEVDAVFLVHAVFRSALSQKPTVVPLLPFQLPAEGEASLIDYIYEPGVKEILDALLPRQVRTQVFRAMLEAVASEHGARMTAMDSASTNAADMIDRLTLQFNRARQAAITKELMEIIGGAEALKKS